MGLQLEDIVALRWSQVDWKRGCLCLPKRKDIPLTRGVLTALKECVDQAQGGTFVLTAL